MKERETKGPKKILQAPGSGLTKVEHQKMFFWVSDKETIQTRSTHTAVEKIFGRVWVPTAN